VDLYGPVAAMGRVWDWLQQQKKEEEEEEKKKKKKKKYIAFKDRGEWKDISAVFQDDGENPICVIAYTDEFKDVMNYFRAILQKDERSQRAFDLTSEVLEQNAANYTAWYFRRVLLEHLKLDLKQELEFVSQVGDENQKNYQIWYHRKVIIEKTNDYSTELKYTGEHIRLEPKNYHAWAHRQWVIQTYNLWEEDMKFVEELIELDFRNNSAWNQRYFLITKKTKQSN